MTELHLNKTLFLANFSNLEGVALFQDFSSGTVIFEGFLGRMKSLNTPNCYSKFDA